MMIDTGCRIRDTGSATDDGPLTTGDLMLIAFFLVCHSLVVRGLSSVVIYSIIISVFCLTSSEDAPTNTSYIPFFTT